MKIIWLLFKKEMLHMRSDRRTLRNMILAPLFLFPIILTIMGVFQGTQLEKTAMRTLRVAIVDNGNGAELLKRIQRRRDLQIISLSDFSLTPSLIRKDSLDLALEIDASFDQDIAAGKTGQLTLLYNSTKDTLIYSSFVKTINDFHNGLLRERLEKLGTNQAMIRPTTITRKDIFSRSESLGKMIGGAFPIVFVLFCLLGAMYPAIDLFAQEKERTIVDSAFPLQETGLPSFWAKLMVVVLGGVVSGSLSIVGIYLTLKLSPWVPSFLQEIVLNILTPQSILLILLMLFPLALFFAGVLVFASIRTRSFKEALSIFQPMIIVLLIPVVVGMNPSVQLNSTTALIPVLNVALASKEIVTGTIHYGLLGGVFLSLVALAVLAIWGSLGRYEKRQDARSI